MTIQPVDEQHLADHVEVLRGDDVVEPVDTRRAGTSSVTTSAKPEKIAPATKNGGKIVECQPGTARWRSRG